jgi:hypothetical protein
MAVQQCCALAQKFVLQGSDVLPDLGIDGEHPPTCLCMGARLPNPTFLNTFNPLH